MFFGRYDYTIDAKGRLNFPAKFRDAMGESFVVLEWVDNCLFALPMEEVERLADKLESDELMDSWAISGDLFSTACEVVPDKQGRILLPAELRAYAGLEKDVTIIGNRNHAEIWATEVWNARRAAVTNDQRAERLRKLHFAYLAKASPSSSSNILCSRKCATPAGRCTVCPFRQKSRSMEPNLVA